MLNYKDFSEFSNIRAALMNIAQIESSFKLNITLPAAIFDIGNDYFNKALLDESISIEHYDYYIAKLEILKSQFVNSDMLYIL